MEGWQAHGGDDSFHARQSRDRRLQRGSVGPENRRGAVVFDGWHSTLGGLFAMSRDTADDAPIIIEGPEQSRLDPSLADGGLPPAVGVQSFQVFRASKATPEITDRRGWSYHHHVDIACWRGRLYVAWNSCQRDEDVWP